MFDDENNAVLDYDEPKDDNDDLLSLLLLLSSQRAQHASPKGQRAVHASAVNDRQSPKVGPGIEVAIGQQTAISKNWVT